MASVSYLSMSKVKQDNQVVSIIFFSTASVQSPSSLRFETRSLEASEFPTGLANFLGGRLLNRVSPASQGQVRGELVSDDEEEEGGVSPAQSFKFSGWI